VSIMQDLIIDQEFKFLLPALDEKTFSLLEENILQNGIRDPIVVWNDVIIDGHNRYAIALKHELPFSTVSMEFDNRESALIWIISTQVSRRNLSPIQLSYFRGLHYHADKRLVGNTSGRNQFSEEFRQNVGIPNAQSTATRLAAQYRVSSRTIERDARVADALRAIGVMSPEAKKDILDGKARITRSQLHGLSTGSEDDIVDIAARIESGTFERERPSRGVPVDGSDNGKPDYAEVDPLVAAVIDVAGGFYSDLLNFSGNRSAAEFRLQLRAHIDVLEDLYMQI